MTQSYRFDARHNGSFVVINGRRVPMYSGLSGRDLASLAGTKPGRTPVAVGRGKTTRLDYNRIYSPQDLLGSKITTMPDRTKGDSLYAGMRSDYSRAIITEQVIDVAAKYVKGNVDFDEENADWMVIPNFRMPRAWRVVTSPMLLVFPPDYPTAPPIGFYLPSNLQSPHGHFFNQVYHGAEKAPTLHAWNWYCCTVDAGAWQPYPARRSGEWRRGDNIWTYITLINEVLASSD